MYKYQKIIDALSDAEMDSAISEMVDNYDLTGKFIDTPKDVYYLTPREEVFKKYFSITFEISNLIETFIQKEFDEEKYRLGGNNVPLEDIDFVLLDSSTPEKDLKNEVIEKLYRSLIDYIVNKAKQITENREHLRIPVGNVVDFNECMLINKFQNKVEFYKDGGWGIAENEGVVLVKNHLKQQPSMINNLFASGHYINSPYCIIQDRDTMKYGVLSYESFHETIHCLYDKIEIIDFYTDSVRCYFIKVMRNGKWGCFDENCALVVDCRYDMIVLRDGFLECIRDAEFLSYETLEYDKDTTVITGKKDLYNKEGMLLIGGYDNLDVNYGYMQFYFGTYYEIYYEEETDLLNNQYKLQKLRLNYVDSKCLILDKEFKTIIRNREGFFHMPKGRMFNSLNEIERFVPFGLLFKYRVDLSHFDKGFIYLHDFYGKQYLVPDYIAKGFDSPEEMKEYDERQIVEMKNSIEEMQKRIEEMRRLMGDEVSEGIEVIYNDSFSCPPANDNQEIIEDDEIVTIIKIDKEKCVEWHDYVNEVGLANCTIHYYRVKEKIGIFDEIGLHPAIYDAITWDSTDKDTYVASFEFCKSPKQSFNKNPNFRRGWYFIHFNKINDSGTLIRMADDWTIFDPTKQKWFPYDFIARHYDLYCYSDYHSDCCSEYSDEDAWDAMTDGMYGDYPGLGWDPEWFGF